MCMFVRLCVCVCVCVCERDRERKREDNIREEKRDNITIVFNLVVYPMINHYYY